MGGAVNRFLYAGVFLAVFAITSSSTHEEYEADYIKQFPPGPCDEDKFFTYQGHVAWRVGPGTHSFQIYGPGGNMAGPTYREARHDCPHDFHQAQFAEIYSDGTFTIRIVSEGDRVTMTVPPGKTFTAEFSWWDPIYGDNCGGLWIRKLGPKPIKIELEKASVLPKSTRQVFANNLTYTDSVTRVIVRTDPPMPDVVVELQAVGIDNTGGHEAENHDGPRPAGMIALPTDNVFLSAVTTKTNAAGEAHFLYGASEIGGSEYIVASAPSLGKCGADSKKIEVRVPGLFPLAELPYTKLVGGTCQHHGPSDRGVPDECQTPDHNHYAGGRIYQALQEIVPLFALRALRATGGTATSLRINDLSLPFGGKFDLKPKGAALSGWSAVASGHYIHLGHANGRAVDIPMVVHYPALSNLPPSLQGYFLNSERLIEDVLRELDYKHLEDPTAASAFRRKSYFNEIDHFHVMN